MTKDIFVHKQALARLQQMVNVSDIFSESNRPEVLAMQAMPLNEKMVSVPCKGTKGVLDRLEVYARGLTDGLLHCG